MRTLKCKCGQDILVDDDKFDLLSGCILLCEGSSLRVWFGETRTKINITKLVIEVPEGLLPDHINGNTHDNRRCNLRVATHSQNSQNKKIRCDSSSGYKGVSKNGKNWIARIRLTNGAQLNLGTYPTKEEAADAYNKAANKHFNEFARFNPKDIQ